MNFTWKNVALFLITVGILVLCLLMLKAFLIAIVGAVVLAVTAQRPVRWLRRKLRSATGAATVALSVTTVCVIVPGIFLGRMVAQYALTIGRVLRNGTLEKSLMDAVNPHPMLVSLIEQSSSFLAWSKAAERTGAFLATHVVALLSNSAVAVTQTIIMLFLLFFLFRDGEKAVRYLYHLLPMEESEAKTLVKGVEDTILATFLGHFLVAVIQGLVAGVVFALLGVGDAALLGVLTAIAAVIPYFGAYVVWLPVAIFLGLSGHWIQAIILVVVGMLVISTLDNLLYPMLVGAQLRQHTAVIFLAFLGGIWIFGIPGLILGPVLFSMAGSLLTIWKARNHEHGLAGSV